MLISRRGILGGMASMLAAPAIVHAGNLMPVKVMRPDLWLDKDIEWFRAPLTGYGSAITLEPGATFTMDWDKYGRVWTVVQSNSSTSSKSELGHS